MPATFALALALSAGLAQAAEPAVQFESDISGLGVVRHQVSVAEAGTWTVSLRARGGAPHVFVSTEPGFRPHDAACAGAKTCTVEVDRPGELYVFVMSEEGDLSYRLQATPVEVQARR